MTEIYISLTAEAKLVLSGAEQRLMKARQNLRDFLVEHQDKAPSPELQKSWERERNLLATEADEAQRFFRKCEADLRELEGASGSF